MVMIPIVQLQLLSVICQEHESSAKVPTITVISSARAATASIGQLTAGLITSGGAFETALFCAKMPRHGKMYRPEKNKTISLLHMVYVGLNYGAFHTGIHLGCLWLI
jgi:hypothetical protein